MTPTKSLLLTTANIHGFRQHSMGTVVSQSSYAAIVTTEDDFGDKPSVQKAFQKADFKSVGGKQRKRRFFPIQNFYLQEAVKDNEGNYALRPVATIMKWSGPFNDKCQMK